MASEPLPKGPLSRRGFLRTALTGGALAGGALAGGAALVLARGWPGRGSLIPALAEAAAAGVSEDSLLWTAPVARFWTATGRGRVTCLLCAQGCVLGEHERGRCRARINVGGQLRSLVYGRPITVHVDPIEKKPFYHFLPGAAAYSLATSGCPLRCRFCQNWTISQASPEDYQTPNVAPEAIAAAARARRAPVIAFTYGEPTVCTEYLTDIARRARPAGIRSVLVSCGVMTEAPLAEMCDALDAIKIDLKGFSAAFYRDVCGGELAAILRSLRQIARRKVHLEIVNLVVPTLNDSPAMLEDLCKFVAGELGVDVPLHFTCFHPDYQLRNLPPTPVATLTRARDTARRHGLRYAYVGNVPGHEGAHTYCPGCGKAVIVRSSFFVTEQHMVGGACAYCKTRIAGVWS